MKAYLLEKESYQLYNKTGKVHQYLDIQLPIMRQSKYIYISKYAKWEGIHPMIILPWQRILKPIDIPLFKDYFSCFFSTHLSLLIKPSNHTYPIYLYNVTMLKANLVNGNIEICYRYSSYEQYKTLLDELITG